MFYRSCVFYSRCASHDCEYCHHNPDASTKECFEWNGEDEEPTSEELGEYMY